jgi:hypothetical protein
MSEPASAAADAGLVRAVGPGGREALAETHRRYGAATLSWSLDVAGVAQGVAP